MKTFKSTYDVEQLRNDPVHVTLHDTVQRLVAMFAGHADYRPEDDGYLVLIERDDVDRVLDDLDMPYRLPNAVFGVTAIVVNDQ